MSLLLGETTRFRDDWRLGALLAGLGRFVVVLGGALRLGLVFFFWPFLLLRPSTEPSFTVLPCPVN